MNHFGILCFPELGHLNPMIALGRELQRRGHNVTFFQIPDFYAYTVWFYPAKEGQIFLPHWRIFRECWSSVWQAQLSWYERMYCYLSMLKQWQGTEFLLIKDLIIGFMTIIQIFKKSVNHKYFGKREKRLT